MSTPLASVSLPIVNTEKLAVSRADYRPDIDGLRAVAILVVVGSHTFPDLMPGGYIGVDIFFVISGFLISGIIFRAMARDSFREGLINRRFSA